VDDTVKEDGMNGNVAEKCMQSLVGELEERNCLRDIGIDGQQILK
jgi:hypothetical protein